MKYLFRNSVRNLTKNKIILITLCFLIFFALFFYTILNAIVSNVNNTFKKITTESCLHDVVINEKYQLSTPTYTYFNDDNQEYSTNPNSNDWWGLSTETTGEHFLVPWPHIEDSKRTYMFQINTSNLSKDDQLYSYWEQRKGDITNSNLYPIIASNHTSQFTYQTSTSADNISTETYSTIMNQINSSDDIDSLQTELSSYSRELLKDIQAAQTLTPIKNYLTNGDSTEPDLNINNDIYSYRDFRSIDIPNAYGNIYYKVIQSENTDLVDKLYTFNKNDWKNFNTDQDWKPTLNGQQIIGDDEKVSDILSKKLDPDINKVDPTLASKKFKLLEVGDFGGQNEISTIIDYLANHDFSTANDYKTKYNQYITYQNSELFLNSNYKYSITWTVGAVPFGWTITDWTSMFCVCSPKYASTNKITTLPESTYINQTGFNKDGWSNLSPTEKQKRFSAWANTLKYSDFLNWFKETCANNGINNPWVININNGLPYINIGLGITPDFLYPIVSLARQIPDPKKECVMYANNSGYWRIQDSFRSNPTEKYIVLKFKNKVNINADLTKINLWSNEHMTWPKTTKAAYLYNDTSDILNASAFRIIYIPMLIQKLSIIIFFLVSLVLLITIFVSILVIIKYIAKNRLANGILNANGFSKSKISFSILPIALIPSFIGSILGYFFGLGLQNIGNTILKNFWFLPFDHVNPSVSALIFALLFPIVFIFLVGVIFARISLRSNPIEMMKNSNNIVDNYVTNKIMFATSKMNIIHRYRISLFINSFWKNAFILFLISFLSCVFVFSIASYKQFENSENKTNASRNFNFAIDLFSPTEQAGQYIPTPDSYYGEAGLLNSGGWNIDNINDPDAIQNPNLCENSFMPGSYLLKKDSTMTTNGSTGFEYLNDNVKIDKWYYSFTYDLYLIFALGKDVRDAWLNNNNVYRQNLLYPMMNDSTGQTYDLQYLKNKMLSKIFMDHSVGMGTTTNPWNISNAMMPENEINLINERYNTIINCAGWKLHPEAISHIVDDSDWHNSTAKYDIGTETPQTNITSPYGNDYTTNSWLNSDGSSKYEEQGHKSFFTPTYLDENNNPITNPKPDPSKVKNVRFDINQNECTCVIGLTPSFIKLIFAMEDDLLFPADYIVNPNMNPTTTQYDMNFNIKYNQVPLKPTDETYTYLDVNGDKQNSSYPSSVSVPNNTHVMGIKKDTNYVSLTNDKNVDLLKLDLLNNNNITYDADNNPIYPMIINKSTEYKYHAKIGSVFSFKINNTTDRYNKALGINSTPLNNTAKFKVVGVCTAYEKEEYFINQDIANYLLGLKTKYSPLTNNEKIHDWYIEYGNDDKNEANKGIAISNGFDSIPPISDGSGSFNDWGYDINNPNQPRENRDPFKNLFDLNDDNNWVNDDNKISYGYNGVFTKQKNASSLISSSISLYSPSGLYPGTDKISEDTFGSYLRYGSNLLIAAQIIGIWNGVNNPANSDLGNKIYEKWVEYIKKNPGNERKNMDWVDTVYTDPTTQISSTLESSLLNLITTTFGNISVVSLVSNVLDKDEMNLIINNISNTINKIEVLVIAVVSSMCWLLFILISGIILDDSRRYASIMKVLGYRDHKNLFSYIWIWLFIGLFSLVITIPFSIIILNIYKSLIFHGLGVLLMFNTNILTYVYAYITILFLIGFVMLLIYTSLKKTNIIMEIKNE